MLSHETSAEKYLEGLPVERKESMKKVRDVVLKNLPSGYEEVMQYGMISYVIPLEKYPNTYNKKALAIASLASQKNYMSLHLMCIYSSEESKNWFEEGFAKAGKKLDMGKSCVRFKRVEDLPLDVIGEAIARVTPEKFIQIYEKARKR